VFGLLVKHGILDSRLIGAAPHSVHIAGNVPNRRFHASLPIRQCWCRAMRAHRGFCCDFVSVPSDIFFGIPVHLLRVSRTNHGCQEPRRTYRLFARELIHFEFEILREQFTKDGGRPRKMAQPACAVRGEAIISARSRQPFRIIPRHWRFSGMRCCR
jgi:hypothetical protein